MDFKDVYKLPLHHMFNKVFTSDDVMAFDFIQGYRIGDTDTRPLIVKKINGEEGGNITLFGLTHKDSYIYLNEMEFISIRGWGHLTSPNCLGLTDEIAARAQDEFAEFIIQTLKE